MTNWSALGGNPVPGDPGGIRVAASHVLSVADKVSQQSRLLQSISGGDTSGWHGPAANAFRSVVGDLIPVLHNLVRTHEGAADAMNTFASELQTYQAQAQQILGQAQQAVREQSDAQSRITSLTPQVQAAAAAYNQAASAPPPAHPSSTGPQTDAALNAAYQNMVQLQHQLGSAQQSLNHANSTLNSCHSHASALHAHANAAAQRCADTVNKESTWSTVKNTLGGLNTKTGWVLNTWGVYGAGVTSDKLFNLAEANRVLGAAKAAEQAAFGAWNRVHGGWFRWNETVQAENAAIQAQRNARSEFNDSIAPAASDSAVMRTLGRVGLGAGMASDVVTMVDPSPAFGPDGLLGGNTDRGMAGLSFAASGIALGASLDIGLCAGLMAVPGVNIAVGAVLIGTAAYFAGEFVYQHWGAISSGVSHAASWVGHTAENVAHDIGHDVSKTFSWL